MAFDMKHANLFKSSGGHHCFFFAVRIFNRRRKKNTTQTCSFFIVAQTRQGPASAELPNGVARNLAYGVQYPIFA